MDNKIPLSNKEDNLHYNVKTEKRNYNNVTWIFIVINKVTTMNVKSMKAKIVIEGQIIEKKKMRTFKYLGRNMTLK